MRSKLNIKIESVEKLIASLRRIEPMKNKVENSSSEAKSKQNKNKSNERHENNGPCVYCENVGYPGRYHAENVCRTKLRNNNKTKNEKIRMVNHSELQDIVAADEDTKN